MASIYEQILRNIESLSRSDQLRLMTELLEHLRANSASKPRESVLQLQGLGKEIWKGIDAQEYVDGERTS